jgi:hypothetical protein
MKWKLFSLCQGVFVAVHIATEAPPVWSGMAWSAAGALLYLAFRWFR